MNFLGRSGCQEINNLRVAYLSGIDSDFFGNSVVDKSDTESHYLGNLFLKRDIDRILDQAEILGWT